MKCINCGVEIEQGKKFCKYCGNPVEQNMNHEAALIKKFCPQCGTPLNAAAKFCTKCGFHIVQESNSSEYNRKSDDVESGSNVKKTDSGENHKSKYKLIALILCILCVAAIAVCFWWQKNKNANNNDEEAIGDENSDYVSEINSADEDMVDSETYDDTEEEYSKSSKVYLDYTDSDYMNYPSSPSDFIETSCPNGMYFLKYPKDFFAEGYYDLEEEFYYFATEKREVVMTIREDEVPFPGDPSRSANYLLAEEKEYIELNSQVEEYYEYVSKSVAESGYSRAITAGQTKYDSSRGEYVVFACNNSKVYTLTVQYPLDPETTNGRGFDYTPLGYVLDCIYRGWSISGSSYELRTIDQYMVDDMGSKK